MPGKDDEGKFHEIDDEIFDDGENRYFHFSGDDDEDFIDSDDGDDFFESAEMMSEIFETFLSLLPEDMKEYGQTAFDAVLSAGSGSPAESNSHLRKLRKLSKGKYSPGIALMEARNCKALAIAAMSAESDEVKKILKQERKALEEYIRYCDKTGIYDDFDAYLFARVERAKVVKMQGEDKGVFIANIEIPEEAGFAMEDVISSLEKYYQPLDDDQYTDTSYVFLSDNDNVIHIEYSDPAIMTEVLSAVPLPLREKLKREEPITKGVISITVDAGHNITSAAMDMQQVMSAVCSIFPVADLVTLNANYIHPSIIPVMIQETDDNVFCDPVLFQFSYEGGSDSDHRVFRSHLAGVWGRKDLGIPMPDIDSDPDIIMHLSEAMQKHIKHAIKDGDHIEIDGREYKASDYKDGDDDIILLREKTNGR